MRRSIGFDRAVAHGESPSPTSFVVAGLQTRAFLFAFSFLPSSSAFLRRTLRLCVRFVLCSLSGARSDDVPLCLYFTYNLQLIT